MNTFKIITAQFVKRLTNKREGETKLGETVQIISEKNWEAALKNCEAKFVLVGIPEDIGVRANYGIGGAHTLFEPALKTLLNVQETKSLKGNDLLVLGNFDLENLMKISAGKSIKELRNIVAAIDDIVAPVIETIIKSGKIPIIIGGGHNNAYPILKGCSRALKKPLNCITMDAHSDYRIIEGRHSGNGFRYAKMDGYLKKYSIIGLHENYNSQNIIDDLHSDKDIQFTTYEDIFVHEKKDFKTVLNNAVRFTKNTATGIELDLDSVENVLSSAATPCGISVLNARKYITHLARFAEVSYLHITEGVEKLDDNSENKMTAKLTSYLITDLI